ncbi:MAG: hypothetical protein PVG95_08225, partial [Methyloceanibacter sp.]
MIYQPPDAQLEGGCGPRLRGLSALAASGCAGFDYQAAEVSPRVVPRRRLGVLVGHTASAEHLKQG